ncbi:uncharacterized protein LOC123020272, partial [Varanus komodoensis]|uniref:uncharacterized protein LOC123020272 n=1 Tax=Varanus komodoensis TaxID=61221 RepID=UPI001CF7BA05
MAQPLLRKTFSRLRGKERLGRKKAAQRKEPDPPPAASESVLESELLEPLSLDNGCRKSAAITVSRKQTGAKFMWGSQEEPHNRKLCQSSLSTAEGSADLDGGLFPESLPCAGLMGAAECSHQANCSGVCNSSFSTKCSSQGAYLQSLERSSRHWVLSSGKTQGAEEPVACSRAELKEAKVLCSTDGEIWYNPIPEDEDLCIPSLERRWGSHAEDRGKKGKPRDVKAAQECVHPGSLQPAASDDLWMLPNQARPAKQAEELSSLTQPC